MKLNDKPKVMYYGREIKALIPKGMPISVMIDVLQKEGDCVENYDIDKRMKCINDCQNTYATFIYSILTHDIIGIGCLSKSVPTYMMDKITKHNFTPEEVRQSVINQEDTFDLEENPGRSRVKYKGDVLIEIVKCGFQIADKMVINDSEMKQYFDLITSNPEKIMKECGVELKKEGGLELIVYNGEGNRMDLPKEYFPDEA